jgi:hypothetical protein
MINTKNKNYTVYSNYNKIKVKQKIPRKTNQSRKQNWSSMDPKMKENYERVQEK